MIAPSRRLPGLLLLVLVGWAGPLRATEWSVSPRGPVYTIAEAIARAAPGDRIRVRGGEYHGSLVIDSSLELVGEGAPVIDGEGSGSVIRLQAPAVTVSGFVIRNSGDSLDQENAGIAVDGAPGARVLDNRIEDVLFGVYLRRSPDSLVRGNRILGKSLALPRRGDAIRIWYSDGVVIEANDVSASRDVVLWYSKRLAVRDNRVSSGRYGLHFMYCDDATIAGNLLIDNSVGAFLMYSRRLRLTGNTIADSHGPSGYGVGLKDMDDALIRENLFTGNRVGAFLDNSPREITSISAVESNRFAANDTGVLLLPNVRRAQFVDNSFLQNREQVAVAGSGGDPDSNRWAGNYWSDYAGYDADADGFGDVPYRSERLFENLSDRLPHLQLFRYSLISGAMDFAARAFPVVRPSPKLLDERPRMQPGRLRSVPELPSSASGGWTPAAAGMVAGALLLLVLPAVGLGRAVAEDRQDRLEIVQAGEPIIMVSGLTKRFGEKLALDELSFTLREGQTVALWGPNGAGKTTALRALLGIVPFEGRVTIGGRDAGRDGKAVRRSIGFVPQEIALQGDLGVDETLQFFGRLRRAPQRRIEELLAWLGLEEQAVEPVTSLSGGMKQRLALGVALLADPPILLLDEPSANLDAASRNALYRRLMDLKRLGKTLVFTSHRLEEVVSLADRVLYLDAGRLIADGPPELARLDEAARTELRLLVSPSQLAEAEVLLRELGFEPRRVGPLLVLTVPSPRKVEPLAGLLQHGVTVEDLALSPLADSDAVGA